MNTIEFYTVDEVATMLRVKPITIYRRLQDGRLEGEKVCDMWRIKPQAIEAFLYREKRRNSKST